MFKNVKNQLKETLLQKFKISDAVKMNNAYKAFLSKRKELENRKHHDIFFESREYLMNNKIKCFKYNYCLEKRVQN